MLIIALDQSDLWNMGQVSEKVNVYLGKHSRKQTVILTRDDEFGSWP